MNSIIWLIGIVAAAWVIIDVWTKLRAQTVEKVLWTVAALLFSILTAIVYYFVKKH